MTESVLVEKVAKAMHDFWQGGGHSASRAWEITVEKLPGQARYFRELAGVALEAAAAPPLREAELVRALREAPCPYPAPEKTAGECFDNKSCGCVYGVALAYTPAKDERREEAK